MAKNTKQIGLIQHRRGKLSELPIQLNEGEFGLALDTNELFIGNSTNPALAERINSNTFPYGNIQILTEFTDNLKKITYRYKSNTDVKAHLPIIVTGEKDCETVPVDSSIKINGMDIIFDSDSTSLNGIINKINNELNSSTLRAYTDDDRHISFITTETSLTLEDGATPYEPGVVSRLGFGETTFTEVSSLPPERTLQERLDDTVSIKSYGAYGDGTTTDDGDALFNAIISLNKAGNDAKYYRTLFMPSGTYLTTRVTPLPYGTHLKGEGIQRTIIKLAGNIDKPLFVTMDEKMNLSTSELYGINAEPAKYITFEDLTIDTSEYSISNLVSLKSCQNVLFKNVEFIGTTQSTLIDIINSQTNSLHICFDECIFDNCNIGINCEDNLEHLIIKNCIFKNNINESIRLIPAENKSITNSIIDGNIFKNCGNEKPTIYLGENTSYISTINNKFDEDKTLYNSYPYETLSNLNYTDILDPHTDTKKILQFNFAQPTWAYIDYLMNPNGEYLIKSEYNYHIVDNEEVPNNLTSGIILEQGDSVNNNTVTIKSTHELGDLNITNGSYGDILLGKDTGYYDELTTKLYVEGDIVQIQNENYYDLYECIKDTTRVNMTPEDNDWIEYWSLINTFNPKIRIYKPIDLNGSYITDTVSNIRFKTTNDNYLMIDDSSSSGEYTYAERIATKSDAIPNVKYVNTIAQTTIRKKFSYENIQNNGKNKQEIIYFNPNIYGDFIYMDSINVNIRRPFYPVLSAVENALEWRPGLRYYSGDVVNSLTDNVQSNEFTMSIDTLAGGVKSWTEKSHSEIEFPTDADMDSNGKPKSTYSNNGKYAVKSDNTNRNIFYKYDNEWYVVGSDDWKGIYPSYIVVEDALPNYQINSIIRIYTGYVYDETSGNKFRDEYDITLSSEPASLENFRKDILEALPEDSGIEITIEGSKLTISQTGINQGILLIENGDDNRTLERMNFEFDDDEDTFPKVNTVELLKSYDSRTFDAENYMENSVWVVSEGISNYFVCIYDNIASDTFNQDKGDDGSISKWAAIDTIDINGNPLKDLKYLSIVAQSNDSLDDETGELKEERLLFLKNVIEADRRDFHSIYQPDFEINKAYVKGDRVLYAGRYWECLENNTSESAYDLHNSELWLAVPEEGFNYHFDFERDIYIIDENDNIITSNDIVIEYNFAKYHFFLMFYDKDQNRLVPFTTDYDTNGLIYKGSVEDVDDLPTSGIEVNDYYTISSTNELYVWNGTEWVLQEPETNLCVSPAGNIDVTINYVRGQGDD